jgi:hypothetical protein
LGFYSPVLLCSTVLQSRKIDTLKLRYSIGHGGQSSPERQLTLDPKSQRLDCLQHSQLSISRVVEPQFEPSDLFGKPGRCLSGRAFFAVYFLQQLLKDALVFLDLGPQPGKKPLAIGV